VVSFPAVASLVALGPAALALAAPVAVSSLEAIKPEVIAKPSALNNAAAAVTLTNNGIPPSILCGPGGGCDASSEVVVAGAITAERPSCTLKTNAVVAMVVSDTGCKRPVAANRSVSDDCSMGSWSGKGTLFDAKAVLTAVSVRPSRLDTPPGTGGEAKGPPASGEAALLTFPVESLVAAMD
jgi:hypothetical protein